MNKQKRKKLEKICTAIEVQIRNLYFVRNEEAEDWDGAPEALQISTIGKEMGENVEKMDSYTTQLNEVVSKLRKL